MDNENKETNLDSLFEDVFTPTEEAPTDDKGQQESKDTAEVKDAPKPTQSAEERSRQAAGRRSREREQIAQQARAAARAEMSATLASLGIENPDNGTVIGTVDELEAYAKSLSDQRISSGRANAEDIRRIARETMQPNAGDEVDRQLETLRDMDPEWSGMTTKEVLGAILESEIGADFRQAVEKGATFIQAYGRATKAANARAKKSAATATAKAAGKNHLGATNQRGTGALDVPADEMAIFRELMPEASDAAIQKYYNADRKKFG